MIDMNRDYIQIIKIVNKQANVDKILKYYKIEYIENNDERIMKCFMHKKYRSKEDNNPSLQLNINLHLYNCFSCPAKGNLFQFVMACETILEGKKSCTFHESLIKICEICSIPIDGLYKISKDDTNLDLEVEDIDEFNLSDLQYVYEVFNESAIKKFYLKKHGYFINRGFEPKTLEYFEMGFGTAGLDKDRCIFPIRDANGRLVGWSGRDVKPNAKIRWLHRPKDRFKKEYILYNLDKALKYIISSNEVHVVESIPNCMRMYEAGVKNCVAILGNKISAVQAKLY